MLRAEYVSAGPETVLVRIPSGRPRPGAAELLVVGSCGSLLGRFDPLPDPPGAGGGGGWRGGFPVPSAVLSGASALRLSLQFALLPVLAVTAAVWSADPPKGVAVPNELPRLWSLDEIAKARG